MSDRRTLEHYRELAKSRIHPEQDKIERESHFIFVEGDTVWYGYVPSLLELMVSEDPMAEHGLDMIEENHSVVGVIRHSGNLDGDSVILHKSVIWPLEAETYEAARDAGFDRDRMSAPLLITLADVVTDLATHHARIAGE